MDPNATLKRIRQLQADNIGRESVAHEVTEELMELWLALDEWLSRGGFLPDDWRRTVVKGWIAGADVHECSDECEPGNCQVSHAEHFGYSDQSARRMPASVQRDDDITPCARRQPVDVHMPVTQQGYLCSLPYGHEGPHRAELRGELLATWPASVRHDDDDVMPSEWLARDPNH